MRTKYKPQSRLATSRRGRRAHGKEAVKRREDRVDSNANPVTAGRRGVEARVQIWEGGCRGPSGSLRLGSLPTLGAV